MKNRWFSALGALVCACALVAQAQANVTYDTTYAWDGSSTIQPWAEPNTTIYGQTFVAPTGAPVLNDFSFHVLVDSGSSPITFTGEVYAWSGSLIGGNPTQGAVGAPLYVSPSMTITDNGGTFQTVTITPNVTLTPGSNYVALLNMSSGGSASWGDLLYTHVAGNGGGGFNFFNAGGAAPNSAPWDDFTDFGDAAWTAHFSSASATPEPSSALICGLGGIGLIGYFRLRRKATA
jgi:hypothetical protein